MITFVWQIVKKTKLICGRCNNLLKYIVFL